MKRLLLSCCAFALCMTVAFAQDIKPAVKGQTYGEAIAPKGAYSIAKLETKMNGAATMDTKVSGKVVEVCEKKGCFMKLENANGEPVMVRFKDYAFFVPKDIKGKTVVIDGVAKQETMSVEKQKHYAADAKMAQSEIDKITEPKQQITFEAKGVVVM